MTEEYAASRYEEACALLPGRLRAAAMELDKVRKAEAEELRLRIARPLYVTLPQGEAVLPRTMVTRSDLEQVLDKASEYSRYAAAETIRHGYVTAAGGFRVGLCGTALPGGERNPPCRVALVDERGELAAVHRGRPQLEVGCHTDVMDGCPKHLAVPMLLRAMTPQVIALDEIALPADVEAVRAASGCGARLLATVHAASLAELESRPVGRELLSCGVFRRAVVIEGSGSARHSRVERLP